MSTEANKAVARRYFEEYLNEGKGVIGDDLFAPDYRAHVPQQQYVLSTPATLNREQHDHVSITFFQAFPDGHFTVEDMIAEGEQVVSRYTFRGTHTANLVRLTRDLSVGQADRGNWVRNPSYRQRENSRTVVPR